MGDLVSGHGLKNNTRRQRPSPTPGLKRKFLVEVPKPGGGDEISIWMGDLVSGHGLKATPGARDHLQHLV